MYTYSDIDETNYYWLLSNTSQPIGRTLRYNSIMTVMKTKVRRDTSQIVLPSLRYNSNNDPDGDKVKA